MAAEPGQGGKAVPAAAKIHISAEGNFLSADMTDAPLREVLAVLAEEARLKVYIAVGVPNDKVSARFSKLPLPKGIQRILRKQNYLFRSLEASPPSAGAAARGQARGLIHILPQGAEPGQSYQMQELGAPLDEARSLARLAEKALTAESAEERLAALTAFLEQAGDDDRLAIVEASRDEDPAVRETAVRALEDVITHTQALDALKVVALMDPKPELRMSALELLVETPNLQAVMPALEQAHADSDPRVRDRAKALLEWAHTVEAVRTRARARHAEAVQARRERRASAVQPEPNEPVGSR